MIVCKIQILQGPTFAQFGYQYNSIEYSHYLRQIIMADRLSLFPTLIFASVDINIAETFLCPFHTFLSHENKLYVSGIQ